MTRSGDDEDFSHFVAANGRRLLHAGDLLTGDRARAEDLVLAAIAVGAPRLVPRPAPAAPPASSPPTATALPVATGRGPGIEAFTAAGYRAGQAFPGHLPPSREMIRGTPQLARREGRDYVFTR